MARELCGAGGCPDRCLTPIQSNEPLRLGRKKSPKNEGGRLDGTAKSEKLALGVTKEVPTPRMLLPTGEGQGYHGNRPSGRPLLARH